MSGHREGGCACGAVRYRARGPGFDAGFCHCRTCRRSSGAPFVGWVTFLRDDFEVQVGEPASSASSPRVTRGFCGRCGTPLTYAHRDTPDRLDVTLASFDEPGSFAPGYHIWVSHKLPWVSLDDGLPRYEESR